MIELKSMEYDELILHSGDLSTVTAVGDFIAASDIGGDVNGFVAFAPADASSDFVVVVKAKTAKVTKVLGDSLEFVPGEKVYYNTSAGKASKTPTYPLIGYAKERAQKGQDYVNIIFDGSLNSLALTDLADVAIASPTDNQVLKYEADDSLWHNNNTSLALTDLADVTIASPTDNQVLKYEADDSLWHNTSLALTDLADVAIASPTDNQVLKYEADDSLWHNADDATE